MAERTGSERAHLDFTLALHRAVAAGGADSCFSPYSVASALGLAARATRGAASEELAGLLAGGAHGLAGQAALLRESATLTARAGREEPVLAVSNTLWAWKELRLHGGFTGELAAWPNGRVATAPFVDDPDAARRQINADVAETTRDLIPELLAEDAVGPDTVASIVNALYLKAAWNFRFGEDATVPADFHAPSGTREVPMMSQEERLGHVAARGWQAVALPAAGGLEAVLLLPDGELAEQESTLDTNVLSELLSGTRRRQVRLAMPRVSLDVSSGLTDALRSLGVHTLFTPQADFGPLTDDPRLSVSDVLHQAVLRVDEQGFEGAAATAVMVRMASISTEQPVEVTADRPFLLLVRNAGTGAVYFLARVVTP
ncbi:serpin family protein [Amycolatopsis antarctica]|uniref:Serpin family protein n=1 Tax=Amycolatopsis antarctica TaxID=1854586 RepID=A0A263DAB7_9PSEU|nr:serpin family protein [Amycolatopsis antarctica]OZM74325.1 serpin family protein [Amycolatopsis antarctica]